MALVGPDYSHFNPESFFKDGRYSEIEGHRIFYVAKGTGSPIILIHGLGSCSYTWRKNLDFLASSNHVIAVDLPGFGFSDRPDDFSYTMDGYARFIAAAIGFFGLTKPHLIGHSFGAAVCQHLLVLDGSHFGSAVLISPTDPFGNNFKCPPKALQNLLLFAYRDCGAMITNDLVRVLKKVGSDKTREILGQQSVKDHLHVSPPNTAVNNECLIIWGQDDALLDIQKSVRALEIISRSAVKVIQACGHTPHEESAEVVNSLMADFLT